MRASAISEVSEPAARQGDHCDPLATEPVPLSPARGPPYFKNRALRRKLGEFEAPRGQVEMFGA